MKATSVKQVIKAIGNANLTLVKGQGYWTFFLDDSKSGVSYEHSVYVMYLNSLSLEQWIDEGLDVIQYATK